MEGEIHVFDNDQNFLDLIETVVFFGYDGPIFHNRFNTVLVEKGSTVAVIHETRFSCRSPSLLQIFTYISKVIINKDKVFNPLNALKNYILGSTDDKT